VIGRERFFNSLLGLRRRFTRFPMQPFVALPGWAERHAYSPSAARPPRILSIIG
jgi:hypothetical protein